MPRATRTERKRDAMLSAARRVFLQRGYRDSTMDTISAEAGVSKRTLYAHFESKEALFVAIVRDVCEQIVAPLRGAPATGGVEKTLVVFGRQFVQVVLSPWVNSLHRLVVAESTRFPELGRLYYRIGQERLWGVIADYLTEQAKRGTLRIAQPRLAAEQFAGILAGHPHTRLQLGVDRATTRREALHNVKLGVRVFLDGCRARRRG